MADKSTPKGGDKPKHKKNHVKNQGKSTADKRNMNKSDVENDSDSISDISYDTADFPHIEYDEEFGDAGNFERLQKTMKKYFDHKLLLIQTETNGRISAMNDVLKSKDEVINKLNIEIGELKATCNFLTKETTELNKKIEGNETKISNAMKHHNDLVEKTVDLEDRSRRNNVIFYNIKEQEGEDCDSIITGFLKSHGFFRPDYILEIDRAHRLGRKRSNNDGQRPRPIIVRFSFFKDKDLIIKKGKLFKGTEVSASEDFSKVTVELHKKLRNYAKEAKHSLANNSTQDICIGNYKVTYKRISITYKKKNSDNPVPLFSRSFSLQEIESNHEWFVPQVQSVRSTYNAVFNHKKK